MKSLVTTTIIGMALLAATPVVHRSQALCAQATKQPREQPKPQPPSQPAPPPPPPPKSTGEPELKRRNP